MSTIYKDPADVPNDKLAVRLFQLSEAVRVNGDSLDSELSMRIPAEVDRDADIVLAEAARRLMART